MNSARRRLPRLYLEQLEQRDCPSLAITLSNGSLYISGFPTGAVSVTETAANRLTVTDNGHSLGTYAVTGNLQMSLTNHPSTITVDLGGNTFTGNILLSLGNGGTNNPNIVSTPPVTVQHGTVGGNVTFLGGNGTENENVGGPIGAPVPVTVRGYVQAVGKVSGGGDAGPGDTLIVNSGSTVNGDVTTTQIDNVAVGQLGAALTTVGGNVNVNDSGSGAALIVNVFGNVGKSVSVGGTNFDDIFVLMPASAGVGGNITGNLTVSLGNSVGVLDPGDIFLLDVGTTVGGSANLSTGSASGAGSQFTVSGAIFGSLTANLGSGNSTLAFNAGATVLGNMSVTGGNGNSTVTADGSVSGFLSFNLGNGNDTVTVGNAPGGQLRWTSGNGNDSVTFGDASNTPGGTWNVSMRFGTGNDTLTLAGNGTVATPNALTGFIDMGGPPGGNSFDPTGSLAAGTWVTVSPFTLQNV
ncbi:MAG TPA: hypothetical protein VFE78_13420 [Gemmataceae bacterium]|jgi:hypothetical protein|nr:hypothetical protein [Gemmataceae bacterium]